MQFSKKTIEAIEPTDKRQVFFDEAFTGFALRVSEKGAKSFWYTYRAGKGRGADKKWIHLGAYPAMTVEQGLRAAKEKAVLVHQGVDPALAMQESKSAPLVKDAVETFFNKHVAAKLKKSSVKMYRGLLDNNIVPAIGKLKVADVEHRHIAQLHHSMRETLYQANRCYAVLHKFFAWAEKNGYRARGTNPASGIEKFKEQKRTAFMDADTLSRIGAALSELEQTWNDREAMRQRKEKTPSGVAVVTPQAANVIRLLCLSGARLGEILSLKWEYLNLDAGLAFLPDSKAGAKTLHLSKAAVELLSGMAEFSEWVFPGSKGDGHMAEVHHAWRAVCQKAGLTGWRIHDLRHAFASVAVNSGHSLPQIGALLGHTQTMTTARYAHVAANPRRSGGHRGEDCGGIEGQTAQRESGGVPRSTGIES